MLAKALKTSDEDKRGTESGTVGGVSSLFEAIIALVRLPLSDFEKADSLIRLLR